MAAVASVATYSRLRPAVAWSVREAAGQGHGYEIVHSGTRPARDVRVRVGSASDPRDSDPGQEGRLQVVRPGEIIKVFNHNAFRGPPDYAFNLTWRSGLRRRSWSYRL